METSTAIVLALVLLIGLWVPYLHLVHPSRESARTYLVHMVEAPGSLRHWSRTLVGPDRLDPGADDARGAITGI